MLYEIQDGTVSLGGEEILSHIQFEIKDREKIGVVGKNGSGKTTLLKLIAGELELDRDDKRITPGILKSRSLSLGYLKQTNDAYDHMTVEEYLLSYCVTEDGDLYSKERFEYEMEFDRMMTGFGFSKQDKEKQLKAFSGGEKTKLSLIHLLLEKPDILLLDEPTNHLDMDSIQWLEEYMQDYPNAVIFVSHDRFFLDQVVSIVYEIENKQCKKYAGNYSDYKKQKKLQYEKQKKAYEEQQEEIKRLNDLILKFRNKPNKAAFAKSRQSILDRMVKIEEPSLCQSHIFTGPIEPRTLGAKWVYEAKHLKIGYEQALLEISFRLRRGQKIGIIGPNGVGKTTFLKTVAGKLPAMEGEGGIGQHIEYGYFDQLSASIESQATVLTYFQDAFPELPIKDVRTILGHFLFQGNDVSKKVSELSGGEKARLILAVMFQERNHLMLLDEPTNHMDIDAKETIESALKAYTGTLLFVSHDRYLISEIADALLVFEKEGVSYYPFGYKHYVDRKKRSEEYGSDFSAMISAENQALIADLKAVPKKERHETKQLTTEEAYIDWKLRLAAEPLHHKEEEFAKVYEEYQEAIKKREIIDWLEYVNKLNHELNKRFYEELDERFYEELNEIEERYHRTEQEWTNQCLEWYDMYDSSL